MISKKTHYSNVEISQILQDIAITYQIKKKDFFRIKSYQDAAETILTYPTSVYQLWQKDPQLFDNIPGIGPNIFKKITYFFETGKLHPHIIKAFKGISPLVFVFTKINGIGPKTASTLTKRLKFSKNPLKALDQLIQYCQTNKIRKFPNFGQKSEESILKNTLAFLGQTRRMTYQEAKTAADKIINHLHQKFPQIKVHTLGSLRRQSKTIGDIDLAIKSSKSQAILDHFLEYPENIQTINRGTKKASIRIHPDIRVDIMIQPAKNFASLLQHFTGSKQHNILLRKHALSLGYSVSEYGIKNLKTDKINTFKTELKLYNFLKLCYIEPKNRIGEREIETAQKCYNKLY